MSNQESPGGVSRRALLKSTALGSLALAAGGLTLPFTLRRAAAAVQQATGDTTRIVWGACSVNCGSRCALRLHVRDDEVVYVETDNTGDDRYGDHQVRACLRGRSIRRRINHPDRLNYPMKRVGKRGEGKFVRISWQEALDTLADRLKSVVAQYGNEAVYINYSSGIVGGNITRSSPSASPVARLMNCYGGSLNQYGTYSTAQIACAMPYTYGSNDGNSTSDIENSKLVVMFGNNPAETRMSGGGITWYLEQARERSNARMIVIDPRYTDTAAGREDEWIPIRPGTDAALVAGIAWVLINEDLVDQPFLDKYCVGYDEKTLPAGAPANGHYKAYILGEGDDGIAKTPQWASRITGIPTERIIKLAPPWQLALGGLIVGGLSLITPAVWGNGYSVVQSYLLLPPSGALLVGVFICKLLAVLASSGSGAPGGVFTPTLFVGLAMGMLFACFSRLWLPGSEEMAIMMGLTGMAAFLAATTHAPIMSTLMICEMTGQYTLLPGLLITCVVSSVLSRTLRRDSIYRHHVAEHV
ncbi:molybdopterin-dependent oxidoreductase [Klebsiella pneumoniae]|uniref:molybdopterin-dependent oxidoreductase n=1 Tax=Klebsiella pneumoniae TaxID=573 RepID=UPI00124B3704|nr:molybdopterin-dependent oxidoreductase [Klebsiella pneumoniae]KAB1797919.1 molybdopterin-dependent oxidoreductase [Klebsiella pneumoniae]CAF9562091.1 Putative dimethyl sulfoxide reductase chain YnfE [Klebsiella pneumoniae]CAF9562274.1 Putative dimethyl sulfoxide reductase chain YnfE [Klebsiella pneumoniae]CAH6100144.1 Putative dimethyl sulfoxide reductase chain YnfE [Klebsiella pneumoniae]CAH6101536.1 Putative dimethyl sulfoxide reductase chain YnfE [Klebsiella pneumoniae]